MPFRTLFKKDLKIIVSGNIIFLKYLNPNQTWGELGETAPAAIVGSITF